MAGADTDLLVHPVCDPELVARCPVFQRLNLCIHNLGSQSCVE